MIKPPALVLGLIAFASPAVAQERCLVAHYRLPATISEELRPYLLCGLIHRRGDTGTKINGIRVDMNGEGVPACADVRTRAYSAAYRHLASTVPDSAARQAYLNDEFKKADAFLLTTENLDDLSVGEEPIAPPCRKANAAN